MERFPLCTTLFPLSSPLVLTEPQNTVDIQNVHDLSDTESGTCHSGFFGASKSLLSMKPISIETICSNCYIFSHTLPAHLTVPYHKLCIINSDHILFLFTRTSLPSSYRRVNLLSNIRSRCSGAKRRVNRSFCV